MVDTAVGGDMFVEVNVSFPHVPCDLMTLDALDSFGEFQPDMAKKTVKHRIEPHTLTYIDAARPIVHGDKKATVPVDEQGRPIEGCGAATALWMPVGGIGFLYRGSKKKLAG